jgi:hypothetical protein
VIASTSSSTDGARAVLDLLVDEFDVALALAGVPRASALGPTCVEIPGGG